MNKVAVKYAARIKLEYGELEIRTHPGNNDYIQIRVTSPDHNQGAVTNDFIDMDFPLEYARAIANAIHAVVDAIEKEEHRTRNGDVLRRHTVGYSPNELGSLSLTQD